MIVYVDMDDVLCDFRTAYEMVKSTRPEISFPQSLPGFFEGLDPLDGAIESVNSLRQQHNLFILTAPSTRNPHCYTEKRIWIEEHFGYEFTKRLIISPDKGLLLGDYLIDDHVSGKGQERFGGEVIHFGSNRFPTWDVVLTFFQRCSNL